MRTDTQIRQIEADNIRAALKAANGKVSGSGSAAQLLGLKFSASAVEAAVRQSQRNEHTYLNFIPKTMAAGCVGYFVQITGRCAI